MRAWTGRRGVAVAGGFALLLALLALPALDTAADNHRSSLYAGCTVPLSDSWPVPKLYKIELNSDDGTECGGVWYPNGTGSGMDCVGRDCAVDFLAAFRFAVPELEQGMEVEFARLLLSTQGGSVQGGVGLSIWGVDEDSPATFSSSRRPSDLARTDDSVTWCLSKVWETTGTAWPLYRASPNIARLVNGTLARPAWGQGAEGKQLAFLISQSDCAPGEANYLLFEDFSTEMDIRDQAVLEVYCTLAETFIGKPMLGRVTDSSVVVNAMCLVEVDVYVDYGLEPDLYSYSTAPMLNQAPQEPIEINISGLLPDTRYSYRMQYREAGSGAYVGWPEGSFRTQRPPGSTFVFVVQSDAHPLLPSDTGTWPVFLGRDWALYMQTLSNISASNPDFMIDLGDFVDVECGGYSRNVMSLRETADRYLEQRRYVDMVAHSIWCLAITKPSRGGARPTRMTRLRYGAPWQERRLFPIPNLGISMPGLRRVWPGAG
jgi:hypothetical protein